MKQKFIIFTKEKGGFGYKPAKVELPVGARICLDRAKMEFATVEKVVESTPEDMKYAWEAAKGQSKYFGYAYFKNSFMGMF